MTSQEIDSRAKEFAPTTAIVLGSGLGGLVDRVEVAFTLPFTNIDRLPVSKVPGHAGQFVFGHLGKARVVIAQGRTHLYEGWSAFEVTAGVRFMASLGIRRLILTNAAGTLAFPPGTWMMLSDHLNLTGTSPLLGTANFVDMTGIYSAPLRRHFLEIAQAEGIPLHEGVYAGVLGPQYETPAEIRMLRTMGADAVGMSTVLEAIQARALGIELAAFSCLTNWAAGISPQPLSHADVLATGHDASGSLMRLLELGVPV
ncbi:MAG: Purine nucleoside phosphorylase [Chthoniobacteraceae bacterium]|nr:Purine nucleoside phosphorylase [Chthoniobacteraceae bacterium]